MASGAGDRGIFLKIFETDIYFRNFNFFNIKKKKPRQSDERYPRPLRPAIALVNCAARAGSFGPRRAQRPRPASSRLRPLLRATCSFGGNPLNNPAASSTWWMLVYKSIQYSNSCIGKVFTTSIWHAAFNLRSLSILLIKNWTSVRL